MSKEQLKQYYEALHYALDREMVDEPPQTEKSLRKACKKLEKKLTHCPNGDALIFEARNSVYIVSPIK